MIGNLATGPHPKRPSNKEQTVEAADEGVMDRMENDGSLDQMILVDYPLSVAAFPERGKRLGFWRTLSSWEKQLLPLPFTAIRGATRSGSCKT